MSMAASRKAEEATGSGEEQVWARHALTSGSSAAEVLLSRLPPRLVPSREGEGFDAWWDLHPCEHPIISMHGRDVAIPRWQAAYGRDYRFSGQVSQAMPLPELMAPLLEWARDAIDARLNGVLMNWYDAQQGHYIGAHRDSTIGLVPRTPIVTISFGETRAFRMRPYKGKGFEDIDVAHGDVLVIPWKTNLAYTHEVPLARRYKSKRISMTLRAFE